MLDDPSWIDRSDEPVDPLPPREKGQVLLEALQLGGSKWAGQDTRGLSGQNFERGARRDGAALGRTPRVRPC